MDLKLCRICGKQDDYNYYVHIFQTEGLRNKIETCLPIIVSEQYVLPDTICTECLDSVDNFYCFIKSCLQNIIVLEAQYEVLESCLKTKQKVDRSVSVDPCDFVPISRLPDQPVVPNLPCAGGLVDYECSSDSEQEDYPTKTSDNRSYEENIEVVLRGKDIIDEISQRKCLKRKTMSTITNCLPSKLAKFDAPSDSSSRRKSKAPKRVEYHVATPKKTSYFANNDAAALLMMDDPSPLLSLPAGLSIIREPLQSPARYAPPTAPTALTAPPACQTQRQACLLCDQQTPGLLALAAHMYETHGIDLAQVYGSTSVTAKPATPPAPQPTPPPPPPCKNRKIPELVKISDVLGPRRQKNQETPEEVVSEPLPPVQTQPVPIPQKSQYSCIECPDTSAFLSFGEYSTHRRSQHQIFHCDLCPKFYGRNSHLWKHVNRVHKGHPSITCHQCYKTSASKYHLAQHFNKMHSTKTPAPTVSANKDKRTKSPDLQLPLDELEVTVKEENDDKDDLLNQKFQGFDFKSVRQSFLKQDLLTKRHNKNNKIDVKHDLIQTTKHGKKLNVNMAIAAPKEIDSSSDLYTNIITNYSPRQNEGPFKCAKCFKGFHKKNLLIKHKKNCRPRLQKDLLTRCKTCSRIFKDRQSLAKHLVNYHSEYTCEICHVAVQSKCEIVSHIRFTHPNSEALQCHCGQILRSRSDLARHKSDHRDSHVCQFCGDDLPTKIKLKMHILSLHRKILSLSCGICLKLFETQHILKEHVRLVHGDQLQPLTSCTVCGKNYGSKWKTYDHLNKSHGRIFKACKACLDVFETDRELQLHFEREHLRNGTTVSKPVITAQQQPKLKNHVIATVEERNGASVEDPAPVAESSASSSSTSDDDTEEETPSPEEELKVIKVQNGLFGKGTQDAKLSLLEKRLMGKKITTEAKYEEEDEKEDDLSKMNHHKRSNQPSKTIAEPEALDSATSVPPNTNNKCDSGDILQNSSKRTVYVNSNDPSLCEICLKVWPAKKHLWQHYIRCHKQVAATVCGICLKTNATYARLQTHLRDTHPNLLHGCGFGSNFICKICGRYHNASSKLKLHMAIHVGFTEDESNQSKEEQETEKIEEDEQDDFVEDDEDDDDDEQEEDDDNDENECEPELKAESDSDSDTEDEDKEEDEEEPDQTPLVIKQEVLDINYESMIEEIEASSDSNSQTPIAADPSQSSSEEESDSPTSDVAEHLTENELEQEMLKNMIGENRSVQLQVKTEFEEKEEPQLVEAYEIEVVDAYDVKMEVCSDEEEEEEEEKWAEATTAFVVKQSEVDDAIRSISLEQCEMDEDEDYNEELNESELETAVGSIL